MRHRGSFEKGRFPAVGFSRKGRVIMAFPQVSLGSRVTEKIRTDSDKAFHPGLLKGTYDVC
jgi:hypothetical protein